ncbi:MAG: hypothetical protein Q9217_001393 [Psora testacea]
MAILATTTPERHVRERPPWTQQHINEKTEIGSMTNTRMTLTVRFRDTRRENVAANAAASQPGQYTMMDMATAALIDTPQKLKQDDLEDLFTRIAPITSLSLRFDRAGRSTGTAYVTYASISAANRAIREFDGANAAGQPIRLTLLPTAPASDLIRGRGSAAVAPRNPFDTAVKPGRSLFDRVEEPSSRRSGGRSRSRSPGAPRRSNVSKPPPEGVDRYVPSDRESWKRPRRSRTRSPPRRRRTPIPGERVGGRGREIEGGKRMVNGRPRKTQEELDKEMEDYWGSKGEANGIGASNEVKSDLPAAEAVVDEDIDMII